MNNKNYDVDTLLQKALKSSEEPDADLIKKVKYELPQKKSIIRKSFFRNSFSNVAAIIIATLVLTTTALTAAGYLGGFDRLKTIIGGERASLVQPIEISNVVGETITEDGIRVELVAIGVFDNVVDIYLTLEDMVGNRLDDNFDALFFLDLVTAELRGIVATTKYEVIDRTDGVITLYSRQIFSQSLIGEELAFSLRRINYNIKQYFNYEIYLDLTTAMSDVSTTQLIIDHDPLSIGIWGTDGEKVRDLISTTGITILEPNIHDIDLGFEGIETLISAIGIIDGRLHIQLYEPSPSYSRSSSSIHLLNPQGELVEMALSVPFSIDEYDSFYISETYTYYRENIFIVDLDRLSEYSLFGHFHNSDLITLDWTATFEVDNNEMQLIIDGLDIKHGVSTTREIRVNPFALLVAAEIAIDEPTLGAPPPIRINTVDGVVTTTLSAAARGYSDGLIRTESGIVSTTGVVHVDWIYNLNEDFLDLDSVISIEIAGETIQLR